MNSKFKGTGVAVVTPFHKDGSIDFNSLGKLLEYLIGNGVNYIVALGTTGESVTLTKDEKVAILNYVVDTVEKRVPVVLGLGGNNTQDIIYCLKHYDLDGVDAILSVSPYYNKPTQEGIYQHYKMIGNSSPLPIILYNVPGRTASNISAETTLRLANDIKNIIGIKEASGNIEQCMKIIKNKPRDFLVISGDDALTLPIIACGADGVISVVANAFPKLFSQMVNFALEGNVKAAQKNHYKLLEFIENLFVEGNPGGIKAALKILKITQDTMRLPLVNVGEITFNKLKKNIESLN